MRLIQISYVLILETKRRIVNYLSDEYIMEKVKSGNIDFMTELFNRYNNQILNWAYCGIGICKTGTEGLWVK